MRTDPGLPITSAASVSPRRIASTPSWIADAPEAQAVESPIGAPRGAEMIGDTVGDAAISGEFIGVGIVDCSSTLWIMRS